MVSVMAIAKLKSSDSSHESLLTRTCDDIAYASAYRRACCACRIGKEGRVRGMDVCVGGGGGRGGVGGGVGCGNGVKGCKHDLVETGNNNV